SLINKKEVNAALDEAELAVALDSTNGRYAYDLGDIYLYHTDKRTLALRAFEKALENGFVTPIVFHRKAMCLFHLSRHHEAIVQLHESIERNFKALEVSSNPEGIKRDIADSYDWLTKQYEALADWENFYQAAKNVGKYDPKNQWYLSLMDEGLQMMGYTELSNKNYDKASEYLREALDYKLRINPKDIAQRYMRHMAEIAQKRKRLGEVTPDFIHKAVIVYIHEVDITLNVKGKATKIHKRITDGDKKHTLMISKAFREVIETFSDGHLSVSVDTITMHKPLTNANIIEINAEGIPIFRYQTVEMMRDIYKAAGDKFDTFIYVLPTHWGEAHGGGHFISIPNSTQRALKGVIEIAPRFSLAIWNHEFFHVIEAITGIKPVHGHYKTNKHLFPEWKGEADDEMSFHQYHYNATLPKFGWKNLKFVDRKNR
ncbi:MAG TPA: tetratricopeptide repeat protein, partial [Bacteroidota bacterium]|nr:tetratricopeptide repeat protein [Bacteroidota bacterium]